MAGRLGETGYDLLVTWAKEQQLDGFVGTAGGAGATIREHLYEAVKDSLKLGAVDRSSGWNGWAFFREHLAPNRTGVREAEIIKNVLMSNSRGFRGDVLRFLSSDIGRKNFEEFSSERSFHEALRASAGSELVSLLDAISIYETFSRICQDAFDDVLVEMTRRGGTKVKPKDLAEIETVKNASKKVPDMFNELLDKLEPFQETARFASTFAPLAERTEVTSWVDRLLCHHIATQRKKPPIGKSPWFERFDDGGVIIRPLYRREKSSRRDNEYLHAYRTYSLYTFASDLHLIKK